MNNELWNSNNTGIGGEEPLIEIAYNTGFTAPSTAVVEAIASIEDVCPIELSTSGRLTLTDYVDPDALDQLFTGEDVDDIMISFSIDEYTVWIRKGKIRVRTP